MDEDQSEGEDDDNDEDDDDDTVDEECEEEDEEDDVYDEHHNDTTEEADEDENWDNVAEETAYTTTQAFTTKMLNANESFTSNKSVTFADTTVSNENITAESFCLSQKPCSLQMYNALQDADKFAAFKAIFEVS